MKKIKESRKKKLGLPPGTMVYLGRPIKDKVTIEVFVYNEESYIETEVRKIDEIDELVTSDKTVWINVNGVHDVGIIEKIGEKFNLHPLLMEDIVNTTQKPKIDEYDEHLFFCCKMLSLDNSYNVNEEHISFVLGKNYVITFQERKGDVFEPIRERIRTNRGKLRKMKADYLAYALLDILVDNYYIIVENISEKIEAVEEEVVKEIKEDTSMNIYKIKKDVILVRRYIWPLRLIVSKLRKNENNLIQKSINIFLKDVYDHIIEIIETIEIFRETLSGLLDINMSGISYKMNAIIKVLTIISTIFIPLTFIAGIYGMNFEYMPELKWKYGYFTILAVMGLVGLGMLYFFRRKKWI